MARSGSSSASAMASASVAATSRTACAASGAMTSFPAGASAPRPGSSVRLSRSSERRSPGLAARRQRVPQEVNHRRQPRAPDREEVGRRRHRGPGGQQVGDGGGRWPPRSRRPRSHPSMWRGSPARRRAARPPTARRRRRGDQGAAPARSARADTRGSPVSPSATAAGSASVGVAPVEHSEQRLDAAGAGSAQRRDGGPSDEQRARRILGDPRQRRGRAAVRDAPQPQTAERLELRLRVVQRPQKAPRPARVAACGRVPKGRCGARTARGHPRPAPARRTRVDRPGGPARPAPPSRPRAPRTRRGVDRARPDCPARARRPGPARGRRLRRRARPAARGRAGRASPRRRPRSRAAAEAPDDPRGSRPLAGRLLLGMPAAANATARPAARGGGPARWTPSPSGRASDSASAGRRPSSSSTAAARRAASPTEASSCEVCSRASSVAAASGRVAASLEQPGQRQRRRRWGIAGALGCPVRLGRAGVVARLFANVADPHQRRGVGAGSRGGGVGQRAAAVVAGERDLGSLQLGFARARGGGPRQLVQPRFGFRQAPLPLQQPHQREPRLDGDVVQPCRRPPVGERTQRRGSAVEIADSLLGLGQKQRRFEVVRVSVHRLPELANSRRPASRAPGGRPAPGSRERASCRAATASAPAERPALATSTFSHSAIAVSV